MFGNFMNLFFESDRSKVNLDSRQEELEDDAPDVTVEKSILNFEPVPVKKKYQEDVTALQKDYLCQFRGGHGRIDISLQNMLTICPRERKRIDAYRGLVSYLKERYGLELNITSQKTKKEKQDMNKKDSKVFITTKVYDLLAVDRDEVIKDVQNTLDSFLGPDKVKFEMVVWKKEVILNFFRSYMDELEVDDKKIYCWDADLITGRRMGDFILPYSWPTIPFGYLFYLDQSDFKECYKKSAKELGASKFKDMVIEPTKDVLTVRLLF